MGNQSFARPFKARRRHPPPPRLPFAPRPGRRGLWWGSGQRRHPPPPRLPCGPRPGRRGLWRGSGQRRRPPSLRRKVCHVTMLFTHTSLHAPGAHLPVFAVSRLCLPDEAPDPAVIFTVAAEGPTVAEALVKEGAAPVTTVAQGACNLFLISSSDLLLTL